VRHTHNEKHPPFIWNVDKHTELTQCRLQSPLSSTRCPAVVGMHFNCIVHVDVDDVRQQKRHVSTCCSFIIPSVRARTHTHTCAIVECRSVQKLTSQLSTARLGSVPTGLASRRAHCAPVQTHPSAAHRRIDLLRSTSKRLLTHTGNPPPPRTLIKMIVCQ
jgi:hypothetical protein